MTDYKWITIEELNNYRQVTPRTKADLPIEIKGEGAV
jgi:hypothetical protein